MHYIRNIVCFVIALFFASHVFALDTCPHAKKISRVIYVTLDGVRWQDIFLDRSHFKTFWRKHAKHMEVYGDPTKNIVMEVASVPTSLPSYQSQMSGEVQPCMDNACGQITVETLPENLLNHFGFDKKDVAIFASWYEIANATEHLVGTTYTNAGNHPVYDPITKSADNIMAYFNKMQKKLDYDGADRLDILTFGQAMHYLETYQPRFLWLSLTDADTVAHLHDLNLYHAALDNYDLMIDDLFKLLKTLKLDKETMVIITTDHGRGDGDHWTDHGPEFPESKQTWAFVKNGSLIAINSPFHYSTLSMRPTIERVFAG